MRKRWQAKLREVHAELRRRMHDPVPEQGTYLRSVVSGHVQYYGVPGNSRSIKAFRWAVGWVWRQVLRRRSHKHRMTWARMYRFFDRWLPPARIPCPGCVLASRPEARAGCRSPACPDPCGGRPARAVPTATTSHTIPPSWHARRFSDDERRYDRRHFPEPLVSQLND
jgi:hypothetical protein